MVVFFLKSVLNKITLDEVPYSHIDEKLNATIKQTAYE